MGGSFDAVPNVDVYRRYQPRPLPDNAPSSGPHSIYFQLLGDHGFLGLGIFLLLMASCLWTLFRVRRSARQIPSARWLIVYSQMVETSILAFMLSGAFLGVVYLDVIYQMIGLTVVLKMLFRKELQTANSHTRANLESQESQLPQLEEVSAPA